MTPPVPPPLNAVLLAHRQFPGDFCSVSALEFVSKLYGLTPVDHFPLQSNKQNTNKGFVEPALQTLVGLEGEAQFYDTRSALALIETETSMGRFPIVSLFGLITYDGKTLFPAGYHIFVAARHGTQSILIDPGLKRAFATTTEDVAKALEWNSRHNPERTTINILCLAPK